MEKKSKVPLVYGFAVCLVAVVTFIICVAGFVNAYIDLDDPLYAERDFTNAPSLASFENYKMDIMKAGEQEKSYSPDDEILVKMYESAKTDKIRSVKHRTMNNLVVNAILLVICVSLFTTHWTWMRRLRIRAEGFV